MKLGFRKYLPPDRPGCLGVFRSNIPRFFREFEQADFEGFIDAAGHPYFVVEESGKIIGGGGYGVKEASDTADLCWGMVDSAFHGRHIGEYLLLGRLYEIIVRQKDICRVRLGTSQLTDGFYQKYGFTVQKRQTDGIDSGLDDVEMRLELTEDQRDRIIGFWKSFNHKETQGVY